jgi:hypothetical protein
MFGPELADRSAHPGLQAAATESFELLREAIGECQRAGLIVGGDPTDVAVALWSTTHGLAALLQHRQLEERGTRDPQALAERVSALMFLGLAPRGAAARAGSAAAPQLTG